MSEQLELIPQRLLLGYRRADTPDIPEGVDPMNPAGKGPLTLHAGPVRSVSCAIEEGEHTRGNDDVDVRISFDGEVLEVRVQALTPLRLESSSVTFTHTFAPDERVLMNGYQSWTDTCERAPRERMRGLHGIPTGIVRKYVLDGGGDYRFVNYPNQKGLQHGFTYATFRRGAQMALLGSLDEASGFTLVRMNERAGSVWVERECPVRMLAAGEEIVLCRLALVHTDGASGSAHAIAPQEAAARAVSAAYERWLELAEVSARPARPLVGYTSWYRHAGDVDADKLEHDLAGCAQVLDGLGDALEGAGCVFQIDDGYAKVGDWLEPDPAKFPQGMAPLAAKIRAAGLVPGLWVAPFVCERDSHLFAEHPAWLLRDEQDELVSTGSHWSGAYALDTRNSEVRAYITRVLHTITSEWGFTLLKCDFLYAACMIPHGELNRGELMADALDLVRQAVGDDVAILACGVPLGSAAGRVEYCRIGCDVTPSWDGPWYMRRLHRERPSTRMSLANTVGRAPLDGRVFRNDPDVFYLRDDVKLTPQQRTKLLSADSRLASCLLTSDDMGAWSEEDIAQFEKAVRAMLARARVRDAHADAHTGAHGDPHEHAHEANVHEDRSEQ